MDLFYREEFEHLIEYSTGKKIVSCHNWWSIQSPRELRLAMMLEF